MSAYDILLISPHDSDLQTLLEFRSEWFLKFNASKSNIIPFGTPNFSNNEFILYNSRITHTDNIKYLGINIPRNLDFNSLAIK